VLRTAGASAFLLGTAFALDPSVRPGFPDTMPGVLAEEPGETTGDAYFLFGGTAALAAEGLLFHHPYSVETAKKLGIALTASSAAVTLLKLATHRERPDGSNAMSFPSGHTTVAFAAATVLQRQYGGIVGWLSYGAAAAAGEARIADNHHYLSDVVAGALLGHFIGRWVTRKSP
jgi:membrane-associated phospholipid phosphatase